MHEPSTWSGPQHQPVPKPTHISHVVGDSGGDFQDHGRPAWDGVLCAALALGGAKVPLSAQKGGTWDLAYSCFCLEDFFPPSMSL